MVDIARSRATVALLVYVHTQLEDSVPITRLAVDKTVATVMRFHWSFRSIRLVGGKPLQ